MSALGRAIEWAFEDMYGAGPAAPGALRTGAAFRKALAVGPGTDADAVDLLEKFFAQQAEIDEFVGAVGKLMAEHAGDAGYQRKCRKAIKSRSDLAKLEQLELLRDWWPPVGLICTPM